MCSRTPGVAEQRDSDALSLMGRPYDSLYEMPLGPYTAEEGMTLSELVRRVGNLVNVVLTYSRGDVQQFIEEAMEADHPIWTDGIDPIDVQPVGSPPLFPDVRTKGSEDYKWDLMLLIAIVEEP